MESDTPRTDALVDEGGMPYDADFARQLERELAAAKKRIAELEAQPPADRDKAMERWMDQVTAMLCHSMTHSHDAKQELVNRCDKAIDAMRKGATDGK